MTHPFARKVQLLFTFQMGLKLLLMNRSAQLITGLMCSDSNLSHLRSGIFLFIGLFVFLFLSVLSDLPGLLTVKIHFSGSYTKV